MIQWSPVQYSNGPVTGYRVQIQKSNQFNVYGATNNTAALTLATLSDTVLVKVSALNDVGCGPSTPQNFSLNRMLIYYCANVHYTIPSSSTWIITLFLCEQFFNKIVLGSTYNL